MVWILNLKIKLIIEILRSNLWNTINSDDVDTIHNHFKEIRGRARIHRLGITQQDYVVGVMYGSPVELNGHYKKLRDEMDYTVLVGIEFWEHLTGDKLFFSKLTDEFRARANVLFR